MLVRVRILIFVQLWLPGIPKVCLDQVSEVAYHLLIECGPTLIRKTLPEDGVISTNCRMLIASNCC